MLGNTESAFMENSKVLYSCMTKATQNEEGSPRYSLNWAVSQRGSFIIYSDRVQCGDWIIPFSTIIEATIYHTSQIFIPVNVLELKTTNGVYQFGFNPWAKPFDYLKLNYKEENVKLKMSAGSLVARLLILLGLYLMFRDYFIK